jgi:GH25 family lysozyme M1 (1,4-beta-N-acetylmuramidase)
MMKNRITSALLRSLIIASLSVVFTAATSLPTYTNTNININNTDMNTMSSYAIFREPAVIKHGIDISRWQEEIDWSSVARTNLEFVMIRAAVGAFKDDDGKRFPISEDSKFREHIAGAQENGFEVGVYMYSYAKTVREIRKEAHFLVDLLENFHITYPVTLDMEESRKHYIDDPGVMAEEFLDIIMEAGYFPMLYSYKSWLHDHIDRDVRNKYVAWVAHLDVPATTYHGSYFMWQYSHTGRVSGIDGDVDLNIAYRDFAEYIKKMGLNGID